MALVIFLVGWGRREEEVGGGGRGVETPTRVPEFTCDFAFKVAQLNCGGGTADENN